MPPRGGRKTGYIPEAELRQLLKDLKAASRAAGKVTMAYRAQSIPYRAAQTVQEDLKHLADLVDPGNEEFKPPTAHSAG